jgi:hypothetical protein
MKKEQLTLKSLKLPSFKRQYAQLFSLYKKLFFQKSLSDTDRKKLLSIAVLFTNQENKIMSQLGYRIALAYGNKTNDYRPLYDISINSGLIPIAALIKKINTLPINIKIEERDSFFSTIVDSYIDIFRKQDMVLTEQQFHLNNFFIGNLSKNTTVVAPTSYGKSELIISAIQQSIGKKICIIVPSKALLAQTRRRIINANLEWVTRIVSHPEMHKPNDSNSIYILTQERLTRILNADKSMAFEIVLVDEAHNMLDGDSRNLLLTSTLRMLDFRNPKTAFKFLTPFIQDANSLEFRDLAFKSVCFTIDEYIKSEKIYIADFRSDKDYFEFYDHFFHEYTSINNNSTDPISYIKNNSKCKNIIYFNKPKNVQEFALKLAYSLPETHSEMIDEAVAEIGASVHNQYHLLQCMRRGVLYHHGSMSDAVRNYTEYLYQNCPDIRYLISSSTLLEGVNLPIEIIFLLEITKGRGNLSPSQFKNLIGRVNRFGDIFNAAQIDSLKKLQPEIHLVASDDYSRKKANYRTFVEKVMHVNKKHKDKIKNVLLEGSKRTEDNEKEYKQTLIRLENIETGITKDFKCPIVSTTVGLKLLENNISEINIFQQEKHIQSVLSEKKLIVKKIKDSNTLMTTIADAFVVFIPVELKAKAGLLRLKSEKAQAFYAMFLDWKINNTPMAKMISKFIKHWGKLPDDELIFVGHRWGDSSIEESYSLLYTRMSGKSVSEKINLAIVRIKEEEDFFDYEIFRFIEVLHELNMMDETFYKKAKYGTADSDIITLVKNGFSRGIAELLIDNYSEYFELFEDGGVIVSPKIHNIMKRDKLGFLKRYEIKLNVKIENI